MADRTKIEWTSTRNADGSVTPGATWNPITGCSVVSAGCKHCYAMKLAGTRLRNHPSRAGLTFDTKAGPVWNGYVRLNKEWLLQPWHWTRPRRIFVCAHGDLFHEGVPFEWIAAIFWIMSVTTRHTYQVLTKRPERALKFFKWVRDGKNIWEDDRVGDVGPRFLKKIGVLPEWEPANGRCGGYDNCGPGWPYENVWIGVSVENQEAADARIPLLLQLPAAVRFLSCEPLLGPIDLESIDDGHAHREVPREEWGIVDNEDSPPGLWWNSLTGERTIMHGGANGDWSRRDAKIDWVIAGGESGTGARPMHPEWARSLRDQCAEAGVPFFFKQWGNIAPIDAIANHGFDGDAEAAADVYLRNAHATGIVGKDVIVRCGKKAAGRMLDGREHSEFPA